MSIDRFEQDFSYDFCISPQGYDYSLMTEKDAEEHFDWFLANIPSRIKYLESFCKGIELDFTYESLIDLWIFFLDVARTEIIPRKRYNELRKKYSAFGEGFVGDRQLSVATEYFVRDIGIYLSEIFKRNSSKIYWRFTVRPKSYFFVNRPMLAGFVDCRFDSPFSCECDPIHLVGVQASSLLRSSSKKDDLYNMALVWKDKIKI